MSNTKSITLSDEQQRFIECAKKGQNIKVSACIGSGKTTAIQKLCDVLKGKSILYLTYNKLLKLDAQSKIKNKGVVVQNYHGFAYNELKYNGVRCPIQQLIKVYNEVKPPISEYFDVLILDEYQDIDDEISKMLTYIKGILPNVQIVAVGDMEQKIYDYTDLDIVKFMDEFLDKHDEMTFSRCFRLSKDYACKLGNAWNKPIIGVNNNCSIEKMTKPEIIEYLKTLDPGDVLCLGARYGDMVDVLNRLETECREKYNKFTTYASISDRDKGRVDPRDDVAIFTTFDSSKGLERKVCIVFDFDDAYWETRKKQPNVKYNILRNIFLVAASRGKEKIIFCTGGNKKMLEFDSISEPFETSQDYSAHPFDMSTMFDYKYKEDVARAYACLDIKQIETSDHTEINIKSTDGLIDMSPCIGIFTEACFFKNYDIDKRIRFQLSCDNKMFRKEDMKELTFSDLIRKIRYSVYLNTKQRRYFTQSRKSFVTPEDEEIIKGRLSEFLTPECDTQKHCSIKCEYLDANNQEKVIELKGLTDAIKDDIIYEIKFIHDVAYENFLQLASYMLALDYEVGRIWNIRTNEMFEVRIKDRDELLKNIIRCVTKGTIQEFSLIKEENCNVEVSEIV